MKQHSVFWAPAAKRSYRVAWRYIAKDSRTIADQVFDEIDNAKQRVVLALGSNTEPV